MRGVINSEAEGDTVRECERVCGSVSESVTGNGGEAGDVAAFNFPIFHVRRKFQGSEITAKLIL